MKQIFTVLLFLPLAALAQNCQLQKQVDKFSQEPKLSTGFISINVGLNRMMFSADADAKEINLLFSLKGTADAKCFDDASTAVVTYEGERVKTTFRNNGAMNCEGIFLLTFKNVTTTPSALQRLCTKKMASITFTGNKETIIILQDSQKQTVMEQIACLVNEGKSLIKK